MSVANDPVKLLVRRFMSLSPQVRTKVSGKLLRLVDEAQGATQADKRSGCRPPGKSFLEQFWTEVERAHGDGLYPVNPFANEGLRIVRAEQYLFRV